MKKNTLPKQPGGFSSLIVAGFVFLPTLASAHPGHYHPDENDEFYALRANFLHLHGSLEISLACLALAATVLFKVARNRPVRIAAAITFCGSIALLAAH